MVIRGTLWGLISLVTVCSYAQAQKTELVLRPQLEQMDPELRQELQAKNASKSDIVKRVQETTVGLIEKRLKDSAVPAATVRAAEDGKVLVRFADEKDFQQRKGLATRCGKLGVHACVPADEAAKVFQAICADSRFAEVARDCLVKPPYPGGPFRIPADKMYRFKTVYDAIRNDADLIGDRNKLLLGRAPAHGEKQEYKLYLVRGKPVIANEDIATAASMRGNEPRTFAVVCNLTESGSGKFGHFTENSIGKMAAIVVDDCVVCAPIIQSQIKNNIMITGSMTEQETRELASLLKLSPLPAPVIEAE